MLRDSRSRSCRAAVFHWMTRLPAAPCCWPSSRSRARCASSPCLTWSASTKPTDNQGSASSASPCPSSKLVEAQKISPQFAGLSFTSRAKREIHIVPKPLASRLFAGACRFDFGVLHELFDPHRRHHHHQPRERNTAGPDDFHL